MSELKTIFIPERLLVHPTEEQMDDQIKVIGKAVPPTSMLYWWPKVEGLKGIRKPKTIFVLTDTMKCREFLDRKGWPLDQVELSATCDQIGYPVFMRTDHFSGKHSWSDTCFVESREHLLGNLFRLLDESAMADLPVDAIAIREYIPMLTLFYAFHGQMPVNPEIRFFARDGRIECWHWYWIPDAIKKSGAPVFDAVGRELNEDEWFEVLSAFVHEDLHENNRPTEAAKTVAAQFEGYWSIDFCLSESGEWVLIDMAEGEKSWHPECLVKR
jgi:hypothetical protein